MGCSSCGERDRDLRGGVCFDCATRGEAESARRGIGAHVARAIASAVGGYLAEARIELSWAWERLTRSGDYAPAGYFEREYGVRL